MMQGRKDTTTTVAATIYIDQEFRALIPPPTAEELQQLTDNLLRDGCRDPLVVWKGRSLLLDGHNRHAICEAHNLPWEIVEQDCADRDAAKTWIIQQQLGRRNLTSMQRLELAVVLKPLIAAEAHARMVAGVSDPLENSPKGQIHTNVELGKLASISEHTVHRLLAISEHAPEDVKAAVRHGKMSVNRAYKNLDKSEGKKAKVKGSKATAKSTAVVHAAPVPYAERVRAEILGRAMQVQGEALTVDELAQRWGVATDNAAKYLREIAALVDVIAEGAKQQGRRYTVVTTRPTVVEFKRVLRLEIKKRRKEAYDGYRTWRPGEVHVVMQSTLLDWIEDELNVGE
jgi:hypothetical protein